MFALDLGRRSAAPELLDLEQTDGAAIEACLRDLERINRWTGAYRVTLRWLDQLCCKMRPAGPLTVSTSAAAAATRCAGSGPGAAGAGWSCI
jgi:hypothetical protein